MKERNVILSLVAITIVLIMFFMVNIGYASTSSALIEDIYYSTYGADFGVIFDKSTAAITSGSGSIEIIGDTNAVLNADGMTTAGDSVTAVINIKNISYDKTAELSTSITNSNTEYFKVTTILSENKITRENGEAVLEIKIELIKTPIYKTEKANISVKVIANPQY